MLSKYDEIEIEGLQLGVTPLQIRALRREFQQIKKREPENFVELVEVVLC